MIHSENFAKALIKDYNTFKEVIENKKSEGWKNPKLFWTKILTNIMHAGSNKRTLQKRMESPHFIEASNYEKFVINSLNEKRNLLEKFVPGGRNISKNKKVNYLIEAIDKIESKGINKMFGSELDKNKLICNLLDIKGIGNKQARNIPMDLYHPSFRNGSIPIDQNWKKIGKELGYNWSESRRHESEIISWKHKHIDNDLIKEDWEFDRLVYICLNEENSEVNKILKKG